MVRRRRQPLHRVISWFRWAKDSIWRWIQHVRASELFWKLSDVVRQPHRVLVANYCVVLLLRTISSRIVGSCSLRVLLRLLRCFESFLLGLRLSFGLFLSQPLLFRLLYLLPSFLNKDVRWCGGRLNLFLRGSGCSSVGSGCGGGGRTHFSCDAFALSIDTLEHLSILQRYLLHIRQRAATHREVMDREWQVARGHLTACESHEQILVVLSLLVQLVVIRTRLYTIPA